MHFRSYPQYLSNSFRSVKESFNLSERGMSSASEETDEALCELQAEVEAASGSSERCVETLHAPVCKSCV